MVVFPCKAYDVSGHDTSLMEHSEAACYCQIHETLVLLSRSPDGMIYDAIHDLGQRHHQF